MTFSDKDLEIKFAMGTPFKPFEQVCIPEVDGTLSYSHLRL